MISNILFLIGVVGCIVCIVIEPRKIVFLPAIRLRQMPKEETRDLRKIKRRESTANLGLVFFALMAIITGFLSFP